MKKMPSLLTNGVFATLIFATVVLGAAQPQVVKWSDKSYGPDGPWAAVTVEIGTPEKAVDLLPGGSWMTNIIGDDACSNYDPISDCPAAAAGLYSYLDSTSFMQIGGTGTLKDNFDKNPGSIAAVTKGKADWIFDYMTISATDGGAGFTNKIAIPFFSMIVFESAQSTLPDGTTYDLTIGKLALGAKDKNQTWAQAPPKPQFNGTLLTSHLFEQGTTPSDSYSMHVGSPNKKIAGSLVLGGYHKDRVIGDLSIQPYAFDDLPIDLLDIGIGVADGASPFNFTAMEGLLAEGDATLDAGQQVTVDATQPYLYLPPTTCEAIAKHLPVTFQSKYGLYFWDTTDPQYKKIVNSPAFLQFTFRMSTSVRDEIRINVPFALLDLILTAPIIQTQTPYFPCFSGRDPTGDYSLGRAFLQAATIGVSWADAGSELPGKWFMAQAPGPNTPKTMAVTTLDGTIESSETKWEDTWKGHWTVDKSLAVDGTSSNTSSTITTKGAGSIATLGPASETPAAGAPGADSKDRQDGASGPPIGAIAGGAVGGVLLFGGAIVAFIFFRRRKAKQTSGAELPTTEDKNSDYYEYKAELCGERKMAEMEGKSYQGRFGQPEGQEWRGNGYAHHGQGLGLVIGRGRVSVHEMGTERAPVEMYAPWSPKGI